VSTRSQNESTFPTSLRLCSTNITAVQATERVCCASAQAVDDAEIGRTVRRR
jgi:hypothetical protein